MSSIALVWLLIRKRGWKWVCVRSFWSRTSRFGKNNFFLSFFYIGLTDSSQCCMEERISAFVFLIDHIYPANTLHLFRSSNAWHSHIHLNINFLVLYEREEERKEVKTMKQSSFFIRIAILALLSPPSGTDFNLWPQSYCQEYSVLSTDT